MIEQVARAIAKAQGFDGDQLLDFAGDWPDNFEFDWVELAKAAIQAMREPTEAMIEAGRYVEDGSGDYSIGKDPAINVWQFMIDAALKP